LSYENENQELSLVVAFWGVSSSAQKVAIGAGMTQLPTEKVHNLGAIRGGLVSEGTAIVKLTICPVAVNQNVLIAITAQ
jgi:hypothetical protein